MTRYAMRNEGPRLPKVWNAIRAVHPESPYVLARWMEAPAHDQKKEEAISVLIIKSARTLLQQGRHPTEPAVLSLPCFRAI